MTWFGFKRALRHWWQRRTRGFDDTELWSLDHTIARFVLPRLQAFRRHDEVWHKRDEQRRADIDEIEWALTKMASDNWPSNLSAEEHERCEKALLLFGKHLWSFWT